MIQYLPCTCSALLRGRCPGCAADAARNPNAVFRQSARSERDRDGWQTTSLSLDTLMRPAPTPGPALLCCQQWHPITHLPLRVPCCGHLWLQSTSEDVL